jgi:hypothetical protein
VGAIETGAPASVEATLKYHPALFWRLTEPGYPGSGPCLVGSLTGAVASQKVTEARDGGLKPVGHRLLSAKAQARLTASATARAGTKVGLSDPVVPHGRAIAQRIKGTLGITG